jgi:hypothetical protein
LDQPNRDRLNELMARMATGDDAAAISLYREFGPAIRPGVAVVARRLHASHLTPEDIDGIVLDVCLDLLKRAGSWDPNGGALPWVWAERRVLRIVSDFVGQYGSPFDESFPPGHEPEGGGVALSEPDLGEDETLDRLARRLPTVALFAEALEAVTDRERNRHVLLLYELQRSSGDPSPALTVGQVHGMKPAAVRKCVERTKRALITLAASEARFAAIAGLPILAAIAAA